MQIPFNRLKNRHLKVGRSGENAACCLLKAKGMELLVRNYRCSKGEIDIVARDGAQLVFIEVKARNISSGTRPVAGLRAKQKGRIIRAARSYINEIDNPAVLYRFDLIEVVFKGRFISEIRQWQDHFSVHTKRGR